jgi:hypothetical protein
MEYSFDLIWKAPLRDRAKRYAYVVGLFVCIFGVTTLSNAQNETPKIFWKNVGSSYRSFAEIKPILANHSDRSIYLYKIYPYWNAHLQRFNDEIGKWEAGGRGIGCATVANALEPIEIKPNEEREIELAWELSTDSFKKPKFFALDDHSTLRPLVGKYRIYLSYAFEPWTIATKPRQTFAVYSDFELVKGKK